MGGICPTGYDSLPPMALRILEIRGLMAGLKSLPLADRICDEYGVDVEDMKILAGIEQLLEENTKKAED
jgi:hypothetical protein